MSVLALVILDRAAETFGEYLPRFGGALVLLVVGLLLARLVGRLLVRVLLAAGLDRLADRARVHDVLARASLERSLSQLIGLAVRLALYVAVIFAAVSQLGVEELDQALNEGVIFLPKLLAALALALLGVVLGGLARERVERLSYQMDLRGPLGSVAQWAVIAVFAVLARDQVGVPTAILIVLAGIVTAGVALTFALAFGLGSRDFARAVTAGRYVSASFRVGQEVALGDIRGEIVAIETASTVVRRAEGGTARIPNHVFLESPVSVLDTESGGSQHRA